MSAIHLALVLIPLITPRVAEAACTEPTTVTQIRVSVETAETAFAKLDKGQVVASAQEAVAATTCLGESLPTDLAARLHRARGLALFLEKDNEGARLSFAAARNISPADALPSWMAPPNNPIQKEFSALPTSGITTTPVPPSTSKWAFDGRDSKPRPSSVPTFLQVWAQDGKLQGTWLLAPSDPLPAGAFTAPPAPIQPAPVATVAPATQPEPKREHHVRTGLLIGGGATAVVSASLYGLALKAQADHEAATDQDALDAAYNRNHIFIYSSAGTAAVAVGLGTAAFIQVGW